METITARPQNNEQLQALEIILKAMKVPFETSKESDAPYNPDFVAKIKKGREDHAAGKGIPMTVEELKVLC